MSSTTVKKANGEDITFNFKLENGLPVKPIISPLYSTAFSPSKKYYSVSMFFTDEDIKNLDNIKIDKSFYSSTKNEIWLIVNDYYIALSEVSDIIIKSLQENNLVFYFYGENKKFIKGLGSDNI